MSEFAVVGLSNPVLLVRTKAILARGLQVGELPGFFGRGRDALALLVPDGMVMFAVPAVCPVTVEMMEPTLAALIDLAEVMLLDPATQTRH